MSMRNRALIVGVWLDDAWQPEEGGGFSYYRTLIQAIDSYEFQNCEILYVTINPNAGGLSKPLLHLDLGEEGAQKPTRWLPRFTSYASSLLWRISPRSLVKAVSGIWLHYTPGIVRSYLSRVLFGAALSESQVERTSRAIRDLVDKKTIDIIYFPIPMREPIVLNDPRFEVPYIATCWDLGHRSSYAFPELAFNGVWESRENRVRTLYGKSLFIFCESWAGKDDLVNYLGINPKKVGVIPTFPSSGILLSPSETSHAEAIGAFGLERNRYFLYPAQFWAHKNHYGLITAFRHLAEQQPDMKLVLTGSEKGNVEYIKRLVVSYGLDENVIFAGFVDDSVLGFLYTGATALVMPTMLGPTNMPLLEAMEMRCPVICSDFAGHREMLGEAAIYVNQLNHRELAEAMLMMMDTTIRDGFIRLLDKQRSESKFSVRQAVAMIDNCLPEIVAIRSCWS